MLEAVSRGALLKRCPEKIRKIHRETNAMDSFFSNVAGQAYHFIKNEHHCSCFPVNLKIFLQYLLYSILMLRYSAWMQNTVLPVGVDMYLYDR